MKAFNMQFSSQAKKAHSNPLPRTADLKGGIGNKLLDEQQKKNLAAKAKQQYKERMKQLEIQKQLKAQKE